MEIIGSILSFNSVRVNLEQQILFAKITEKYEGACAIHSGPPEALFSCSFGFYRHGNLVQVVFLASIHVGIQCT